VYPGFVERLGQHGKAMSATQLATVNRKALRIFDACDGGHVNQSEQMFRGLEIN
jgi:hypothetical protein